METSLHRELKRLMAGDESGEEQRLAGYRIDAVVDGRLISSQTWESHPEFYRDIFAQLATD